MKTIQHLPCTLLLLLTLGAGSVFAQSPSTYCNPVIAGNFPDPSVIRVGDTYYAASSSSEWAPAYPLYQSTDLINWQHMGALFKDIPSWSMGSFWAPELYHRNGMFYVYYTARRKSDQRSFIGVATTKDLRQGFTDHGVVVEWTTEAIDAFVIEEGGKPYITWKAYGLDRGKAIEILGAQLSPDGLTVVGEPFSLLKAEVGCWEDGGIEGQCIVRHGDYLYMFYAGNSCCGANCNYMTGVARAKSLRGPWEKYSANPLLKSGAQWSCPGHGTLVETPDHRTFYLYHAYRAGSNVYLGRQGLLDEVIWDKRTAWPSFRYGTTPSLQAETPFKGTVQQPASSLSSLLAPASMLKEFAWDVHEDKPNYQIDGGTLKLQASEGSVGSFLGLTVRQDNYTCVASIKVDNLVAAGICIYGTKDAVVGVSVKGNRIELWRVQQGKLSILATEPVDASEVTLCLHTTFGQYAQFGWVPTDGGLHPIGPVLHVTDLPQWDRPPLVGIQASGKGFGSFSEVVLTGGNL